MPAHAHAVAEPSGSRPIKVELLPGAATLAGEWWELWQADPYASPFQSPAWLLPWRQAFDDGETVVLAFRRDGRLVGLVPLFHYENRLLLWGAGTSDWLDGLFDPELLPSEITRALAALEAPIDLFQLPPNSRLLDAPAPRGWTDRHGSGEPCLVLPLPATLPRNMAQNLRYYARRAEAAGISAPERAGPDAFEALVDLHTSRWRGRGETGVLSDPRVLGWHRLALPDLSEAGLLRFYVMRQRERIVAALYALQAKSRAFYYIGGFNPDLSSLGLGTLLVGHAIAEAGRDGASSFDFLRGRESYKAHWGASEQVTHARKLIPPGGVA